MNSPRRSASLLFATLILIRATRLFAQPSPAATAAFNTYAANLESRLAQQRQSANFLTLDSAARARLRSGELLIENLTPPQQPASALLHHWRATAFVPQATAAQFEQLLRDFTAYPHNFAPDIVSSTVLTTTPTHTLLRLRTRQHHVITVILDTTCDVTFTSPDATPGIPDQIAGRGGHGYSISRSTRIDQIAPSNIDGLLYRLNTYWSWQQADGGLYLQLESLSLTRSIPRGLAWVVQPYLESIPRDSLIFTLTSARNALRTKP